MYNSQVIESGGNWQYWGLSQAQPSTTGDAKFLDVPSTTSDYLDFVRPVPNIVATPEAESNEEKFNRLASDWKRDTCFVSSISDKILNESYRQIIIMGDSALPYILKSLKKEHLDWYWALSMITGVDPIQPEHRGRVALMVDDWLNWAADVGITV